jgi:hypothetical protein
VAQIEPTSQKRDVGHLKLLSTSLVGIGSDYINVWCIPITFWLNPAHPIKGHFDLSAGISEAPDL